MMILNIQCYLNVLFFKTDNLQILRFYQFSSKNVNENMFFTSHKKNCTQGFIVSIFLLAQTAVKLKKSQIYKNYYFDTS